MNIFHFSKRNRGNDAMNKCSQCIYVKLCKERRPTFDCDYHFEEEYFSRKEHNIFSLPSKLDANTKKSRFS